MPRFSRLALLLCAVLPVCADQIVLKNGDRISGSVVKKDGATLTIKSDSFGLITTAWDKVQTIESSAPLNIVSKAGTASAGKLSTVDGMIEIAGQRLAPEEVTAIRNADEERAFERLQKPRLVDLWAGTATIGWAGSLGNARTLTFTTGSKATRTTLKDRTTVYFNSIKATALVSGKSSQTAEAVRGGVAYDRNFSPKLFVNTFNDYEYDKFQNLDLRFVAGLGAGFHARKTSRTRFDLVGGGDYNRSQFFTSKRSSAEAYYGDDYEFKLSPNATMYQTARVFNDLTNTGQVRLNFDTGASIKLRRWLNWNVSISDRYLNTPAPGRKTNDILYTTGFGVSFAR